MGRRPIWKRNVRSTSQRAHGSLGSTRRWVGRRPWSKRYPDQLAGVGMGLRWGIGKRLIICITKDSLLLSGRRRLHPHQLVEYRLSSLFAKSSDAGREWRLAGWGRRWFGGWVLEKPSFTRVQPIRRGAAVLTTGEAPTGGAAVVHDDPEALLFLRVVADQKTVGTDSDGRARHGRLLGGLGGGGT